MSGRRITVQHSLSGREIRSFELEEDDSRTVMELKQELRGSVEIQCPPRLQTLVCGEHVLKDAQKLADLLTEGKDMNLKWHQQEPEPGELCSAVRRKDYSEVEALLQLSSDPNGPCELASDNRSPPLHLACLSGTLPIVELLLKWRADVNAKTSQQRLVGPCTALEWLCSWSRREEMPSFVVTLLASRAHPGHHWKECLMFLEQTKRSDEYLERQLCLGLAIGAGHTEKVQGLLKSRADMRAVGEWILASDVRVKTLLHAMNMTLHPTWATWAEDAGGDAQVMRGLQDLREVVVHMLEKCTAKDLVTALRRQVRQKKWISALQLCQAMNRRAERITPNVMSLALRVAAGSGQQDVVQALWESNVEPRQDSVQEAISAAQQGKHRDVEELLMRTFGRRMSL
ncbi:unnamed protein product [Symbiodinium natans]|uniref:Ubiquitin-like domain-containing protein n=1 Tax=Symbiodinium natans TaxID=878477 RepID=A0A812IAA8_9DINO|nr:unnamed protein product [Symbiodinium natans]